MDATIRYLREGAIRGDSSAPLMVVCDSLATLGGPAMFLQVLQGFCTAMKQGRSQANQLVVAAIDQSPSHYNQLLQQPAATSRSIHIVDLYTDPYSWHQPDGMIGGAQSSSLQQLQQWLLQELDGHTDGNLSTAASSNDAAAASTSTAPELCIVLDSLSTLLLRYPYLQLLQLLRQLTSHPRVSCVLSLLHEDLHQQHELSALHHLASCLIRMHPVGDLEKALASSREGKDAMGAVEFRYQRRTGRVRVERQLYSRDRATGQLQLFAAPEQAANITAQTLVASTLKEEAQRASSSKAAAGPSEEELARALGSTMRLSLTEQERQAREAVRLPYEHQGHGKLYQTQDFKDYLPVAAGGNVAGVPHQIGESKLGHILYVRDSEEEHDSDEDPDEDLDI